MASRIIRRMQKGKLWILGIVAVFVLTAAGESYFEVNKNLELFSSFYKELLSNYADPVDQEKVVKSGIDAMLASLDPYTTYIPESDMANYKFQTTGKYGGIGATVRDLGDYIVIAEPYEGFPAQKAGLKAGDAIVSIDGTDCKGKSVDDISHFLKGPAGSIINITIQRPGQKDLLSIPLQREEIHLNAVSYAGILDG
jgi:carboxyl-terminal processing protease